MKLYITLGNRPADLPETHTDSKPMEFVADFPDATNVTYIGLELEDPRDVEDGGSRTGRMTIMRQPFSIHHGAIIHTMCGRGRSLSELADAIEREAEGTDGGFVDGIRTAAQMVRDFEAIDDNVTRVEW